MVGRLVRFALAQERHVNAHVISGANCLFELHVPNIGLLLLNTASMTQIHQLLDRGDVLAVMLSGAIAKDVHVEPRTLFVNRYPDTPRPADWVGLARNSFPGEGQQRRPG